jgi:nucleoside-diphosphate-sugar epimerase
MKKILVVGASGNTGRNVVKQLLELGHSVHVIVRTTNKLSEDILKHQNINIIKASILDIKEVKMVNLVSGSDAIISCLGHNLSFKGIFGEPKRLCTDASKNLCEAIKSSKPNSAVKFILMSSVGVKNGEIIEQRSLFENIVLTLLRWFIPPHKDNEMALDYLISSIGNSNKHIEWCAVRPDSLIDNEISKFEIIESPITGIFDGRPTSRENVANFMTQLIEDNTLWSMWKFKTPVIMNEE